MNKAFLVSVGPCANGAMEANDPKTVMQLSCVYYLVSFYLLSDLVGRLPCRNVAHAHNLCTHGNMSKDPVPNQTRDRITLSLAQQVGNAASI